MRHSAAADIQYGNSCHRNPTIDPYSDQTLHWNSTRSANFPSTCMCDTHIHTRHLNPLQTHHLFSNLLPLRTSQASLAPPPSPLPSSLLLLLCVSLLRLSLPPFPHLHAPAPPTPFSQSKQRREDEKPKHHFCSHFPPPHDFPSPSPQPRETTFFFFFLIRGTLHRACVGIPRLHPPQSSKSLPAHRYR